MPLSVGTKAPVFTLKSKNASGLLDVTLPAPGKTTLTTQLFFSDDPLHAKDPAFKPELLLTITGPADNRAAAFDFILNI